MFVLLESITCDPSIYSKEHQRLNGKFHWSANGQRIILRIVAISFIVSWNAPILSFDIIAKILQKLFLNQDISQIRIFFL